MFGSALGAGSAALLVWWGAVLFDLSSPWAYVSVVLSAVVGAIAGGAIGNWAFNADWSTKAEASTKTANSPPSRPPS